MQKRPNKVLIAYLTWGNPLIAISVFYFCSWHSIASLFADPSPPSSGAGTTLSLFGSSDSDPFAMYFLGKGIFCSSALFLFGLFFREYILRERQNATAED